MGVNTIPQATTGNVIPADDHNSLREALSVDLVPRNSSAVPTEAAGSLGTSSIPWLRMFFGAAASGLSIREDAGNIAFFRAGVKVAEIDANGYVINPGDLPDDSVDTDQIVDGAVTPAKLSAANFGISASCGNSGVGTTSFSTVTNLSITLTTNGRPVLVGLFPDTSNNLSEVTSSFGAGFETRLARGTTTISLFPGITDSPNAWVALDNPPAGSNTFTFQGKVSSGGMQIRYWQLFAIEL